MYTYLIKIVMGPMSEAFLATVDFDRQAAITFIHMMEWSSSPCDLDEASVITYVPFSMTTTVVVRCGYTTSRFDGTPIISANSFGIRQTFKNEAIKS